MLDVIIEHGGNLYNMDVENVSTSCTFPYSVPMANISCTKQPYINIDDVVRIQYDNVDLFHGRVSDVSVHGHSMNINCLGHGHELDYRYVTSDFNGAGQTSGDILENLIGDYCSRIGTGTMSGSTVSNFDISANRRTVLNVLDQIQILDKAHIFDIDVSYTNGRYDSCSATWAQLPTNPIHQIKYGASNVLDYSLSVDSSNLYNRVKIYGNTTEDETSGVTTQFEGLAEDVISQSGYGRREYIYTDTGLDSNSLCEQVANGLINTYSNPLLNGDLIVTGANIRPGDLIDVYFPDIINGERFYGNYRVHKVQHNFSPWATTVTIGDDVAVYDTVSSLINKHRLNNLNAVI